MNEEEAIKILTGYMGGKIAPESTELYQAIELVVDILESQHSLPSNLYEAAEAYVKDYGYTEDDYKRERIIAEEHFKAGAEWQKEQMMKEAVKGSVTSNTEERK